MQEEKPSLKRSVLNATGIATVAVAFVGLGLLFLALGGYVNLTPKPLFVQGEIDATRVDISPKISGRVAEQLVRDGSKVKVGQTLIVLDSPEIQAKVLQAEAGLAGAQARLEKVLTGSRVEEIRQTQNAHAEAAAALSTTEQTYARVKRLHAAKAISTQSYDDAYGALQMAHEREKRARAAMEMAEAGSRSEDQREVAALVQQSKAQLAEVESLRADTNLTAPITGEVNKVLVRQGELVGAGYPLLTLVDLADLWVAVQLRENYLPHIRMGEKFIGIVPALGNKEVEFEVTYMAALGDFATWRATNNAGSFDLKTFEVHGQPVAPVEGLRPGMSVIFHLPDEYLPQPTGLRAWLAQWFS